MSGNLAARIAKTALKVVSDPAGIANAAFNFNVRGAFGSSGSEPSTR